MLGNRFWSVALCFALLFTLAVPAMASDRPVDTRDLKGISPHHHRYLFSVIGGTLLGAGVGELVGGGHGNIMKGMLIGGGGLSAIYLHSHRDAADGYRDWAFVGSHTALGLGAGWTICGCTRGAVFGALAGAGGSLIWRALAPQKNFHQVARMGKTEATKVKNGAANTVDKVKPKNDQDNDTGNGENPNPPPQR